MEYIDVQSIIEYLKDPISGKLFKNPVLADDNEVYEASELVKWFSLNGNKSPTTNKIISRKIIPIIPLKSFVEEILEREPTLKKHQYKGKSDLNIYIVNREKIISLISDVENKNDYNILLRYTDYSLIDLGLTNLQEIVKSGNFMAVRHLASNSFDLHENISIGWKFANIVFRYGNDEMIEYFIKKEIDLENICYDGWTAGHQLAYFSTEKNCKLIIDAGINLLKKNAEGKSVLEFIITYQSTELAEYAIKSLNKNTKKFNKLK